MPIQKPDPKFSKEKIISVGNVAYRRAHIQATQSFIERKKVVSSFYTEKTWEYDISMFSERKIVITCVYKSEKVITMDATIINIPLVLKKVIKMGKTVKIKERKSK